MGPKVSIVIPVYNGADFLEEAIESALAQTYQNIEIIIVNDGSRDNGATERIALRYADKIRYYSKPNGGVASALNFAILQMSGEYFSWLSHDDLYTEDKVECDIAAISAINGSARESTIVYSDYGVFADQPENAVDVKLPATPPELFRYWLTVENRIHGCTLLIPKTAFEQCGTFDGTLRTTQDYDLWFRLAERYQFVHIPRTLVKARSHPAQGSVAMAGLALQEINALLTHFTKSLSVDELSGNARRSIAEGYAEIAISLTMRGFFDAAKVATKLAFSARDVKARGSKAAILIRLAGSLSIFHVKRVARMFLSKRGRLMLKALVPNRKFSSRETVATSLGHGLKHRFSEIYDKNIFGGRLSRSGEGSDLVQTAAIRRQIPQLVTELGVETFLDAPCGDWYWMQHTALGVKQYTGVDIVEALIEKNRSNFGNETTSFRYANLTTDALPKVDLIFSRDCLVHLSFDDAKRILANFKQSNSKYLLTTTFTDRSVNNNLVGKDSFWRPLNMLLPPFNFPPPLKLINEDCTEQRGQYADKCLGLWRLDDIEIRA
ncbi:glycosyltransferase [Rhizobium leguminosarum]|uniref:Glycosyltransferase n=1 Tax=Rhizobium leguminosarum bv. viciae TaxID=387 RepID=A0A7G6RHZ2_RHILV|nr:glycosyltransferase [Rhizobium leguminosarum]MBB4522298.1 glycosyltransferase involved in cell wall biosynthesis/SAM-dependent methyltransferase [Rhizobium leguminosarum]MDH6659989.1 glycosyltransferase involved in cell wall biosynthesis/SAM-dependent methyltransferase [Rhizobium sophorae]QND41874.1 glycosyltransferase [Rhizobium leguminosarum bv. viciae]TCA35703.1 glycosyltransferase [Rhizobium leguminosarum bv. viciae]